MACQRGKSFHCSFPFPSSRSLHLRSSLDLIRPSAAGYPSSLLYWPVAFYSPQSSSPVLIGFHIWPVSYLLFSYCLPLFDALSSSFGKHPLVLRRGPTTPLLGPLKLSYHPTAIRECLPLLLLSLYVQQRKGMLTRITVIIVII